MDGKCANPFELIKLKMSRSAQFSLKKSKSYKISEFSKDTADFGKNLSIYQDNES